LDATPAGHTPKARGGTSADPQTRGATEDLSACHGRGLATEGASFHGGFGQEHGAYGMSWWV